MSVCGQSGQTEEDSGSEEVTATAAAVRDIYKQKPASKVVRVLTVLAYLLSVSLAAILLSVYYVCVWRSPELPKLNDTSDGDLAARRDPLPPQQHRHVDFDVASPTNFNGGGDSGVSGMEPLGGVGTEPPREALDTTTALFEDSTIDTYTESLSLNSTSGSTNDTDVT